jgi:uncharacterized protein (DUF2062 family)
MLSRRSPLTLKARLGGWIWPRCGFRRAALFHVKRLMRTPGSPHAIAAGVAAGVFAAFTPFVGLHVVLAGLVAALAGGSVLAAAMASLIGNPLTFPVIWIAGFEVGKLFVHGPSSGAIDAFIREPSLGQLLPIIEPLTLGSLVLGVLAGSLAYLPVRWAIARAQEARYARFEARRIAPVILEAAE